MIVLGINAYHGDASACLLRDGVLVAAAEEERFRRVKHWAGFPTEAIRYCLRQAGVKLGGRRARRGQPGRARQPAGASSASSSRAGRICRWCSTASATSASARAWRRTLDADFRASRFAGSVHYVEHHLAHLASAFLVSPFDEAVAVSVDGFGDFASAGWGVGRGSAVEVEDRVYFPHSLGIFYQALTQYLGFPNYGDEYKVMGLAPYGEPAFLPQMRKIVRLREGGGFELDLAYFRHATEKVDYEWEGGSPVVGTLYSPALAELLGPARGPAEELTQRHRDIARSVQAMYEEAFFHLLSHLHGRYKLDALCLAGGCAMNSVANGKVYARSPFRRLYVQSAAGDAGGAIGAALVAWQRVRNGAGAARSPMTHAYYGPEYSDAEIGAAIDARADELESTGVRSF